MKNDEYWAKRFLALESARNKAVSKVTKDLSATYRKALSDLDGTIRSFYSRFATNNNLTFRDAQKILDAGEIQEFKLTLEEYIDLAKKAGANPEWIGQLENASIRQQMTRYQMLAMQCRQQIETLSGKKQTKFTTLLSTSYEDTFYKTAYEIEKGTGVGATISRIDERRVSAALQAKWARDESNYSDRLWTDKKKLLHAVGEEIDGMVVGNKSVDDAVKSLSKTMESSASSAARLLQTEEAHIASVAQKECFQELGVEQF